MNKLHTPVFFILLALLFVSSCGNETNTAQPPVPGKSYTVTITWDENHENLVNSAGGGFKVYHSREQHFSLHDTGVTVHDVPYETGMYAPTSTDITLTSGTWYIKVAAYMDLNGTVISSPSTEQIVSLP